VIGTVLITLLIVGALGAIGFGLWQMGFQRGLVESGAEVVVNTARGVGHWWGPGWGVGFGFFGFFFKILFVILIIGLISRLFFGPRRWGPGPYWGRGWQDDDPHPMDRHLDEWHDRAHGGNSPSGPSTDQDT
jgi:hypothetical protein